METRCWRLGRWWASGNWLGRSQWGKARTHLIHVADVSKAWPVAGMLSHSWRLRNLWTRPQIELGARLLIHIQRSRGHRHTDYCMTTTYIAPRTQGAKLDPPAGEEKFLWDSNQPKDEDFKDFQQMARQGSKSTPAKSSELSVWKTETKTNRKQHGREYVGRK